MSNSPNLSEMQTTTLRNRGMNDALDQKEHGKDGPVPKATGTPMQGQPKPVNTERPHTPGSIGGRVKDGHLRNSGHPGAHRIGKR